MSIVAIIVDLHDTSQSMIRVMYDMEEWACFDHCQSKGQWASVIIQARGI